VSRRRALVATWSGAVLVAAGAALALALVAGGGAPPPAPRGLDDAGRLPAWIGALLTLPLRVAGVVVVGLGLAVAGSLGSPGPRARVQASAAGACWAVLAAAQLGLTRWELSGRAHLLDSGRGRASIAEVALALLAVACWRWGRGPVSGRAGIVVAFAGLLPTALAGHARSTKHPLLASAAVSAHVVGAAAWVGGLAVVAWIVLTEPHRWHAALTAFSDVALACAVLVTGSGVVAAVDRLHDPGDLLGSGYGAIVSLKVTLLGGLVAAGWLQRRHVLRRAGDRRGGIVALAAFELTTMAVALALAAALARTPPPG